MADFFAEAESLKLKLISAYSTLVEQGKLSEEQLERIVDLVEEMDNLTTEEFATRLQAICGFLPHGRARTCS